MSLSQKVLCHKDHQEVSRILNLPAPTTSTEPARAVDVTTAASEVTASAAQTAIAYAIALG
jgi:hypothetical protein